MRDPHSINRRVFLESTAAAAIATGSVITSGLQVAAAETAPSAESVVGTLYSTLSDQQKKSICFDWNHQDEKRGLLRSFVANNWNITKPEINDDFYSDEQRDLVTKHHPKGGHPKL